MSGLRDGCSLKAVCAHVLLVPDLMTKIAYAGVCAYHVACRLSEAPETLTVADSLYNMSILYEKLQRYSEALDSCQRSWVREGVVCVGLGVLFASCM